VQSANLNEAFIAAFKIACYQQFERINSSQQRSCIIDFLRKNNHNTCTTNLEKEHYMQDRANLKNDQTTMNCISCSNASSKMIANDVNILQENSNARL